MIEKYGFRDLKVYLYGEYDKKHSYCEKAYDEFGTASFKICPAGEQADYIGLENRDKCIHFDVSWQTSWSGSGKLVGYCSRCRETIKNESAMRSCCTQPWSGNHACAGFESNASQPCFITTACVTSKGLPDDCDELETLRKYRDMLSEQDPTLAELFREYYVNAPKIVAKIDKCENSASIYDELYNNLVVPCVTKLKEEQIDEAVKLYTDIYRDLLKKYNIEVEK